MVKPNGKSHQNPQKNIYILQWNFHSEIPIIGEPNIKPQQPKKQQKKTVVFCLEKICVFISGPRLHFLHHTHLTFRHPKLQLVCTQGWTSTTHQAYGFLVVRMGSFLGALGLNTLQGINISHLGNRKIIFKIPFWGDMLVPWRVYLSKKVSIRKRSQWYIKIQVAG